jgi:long-chain acyl-CoA synthetase
LTILSDIFDDNPRLYPEYNGVYFEGEAQTNLEFYRRMCHLGNGLKALGMEPGDTLLVHMENHPDISCLLGACIKTGIVFCPTMFLLSADELSWIAEHSEAKYLLTAPEHLYKVRVACSHMFDTGTVVLAGKEKTPGTILLDELCEDQPDSLETERDLGDDDVAVLIYTSGTTGRPKGVLLTHRNLGSNLNSISVSNQITRNEVALSALPLSHSYGMTMSLLPIKSGLTSVLMRWFDTEKTFEYTEKYHINTMTGVPAMYIQLLNHPRAPQYNVRSWRRLQTGAAPLPEEVLKAFREKFRIYLYEGYGLTEASPVVSCQRPKLEVKLGSVGPTIEGVEVKIRDDYDRELPAGSPGEITVRGPNVMKGYLKDVGETERALRGGWLHTGDIGYMDDDGYIYIVERKKDLIITGGFNLYPSEVELLLSKHPAVEEVAVVGEPDPIQGEVVHAFVILKEGHEITEVNLIEFTKKSLVYYKCPHRITFVKELPRTFLGKPSRRDLRDHFLKH